MQLPELLKVCSEMNDIIKKTLDKIVFCIIILCKYGF